MTNDFIHRELSDISRGISRERGLKCLITGLAGVICALAVAGTLDAVADLPTAGRWLVFALLAALLAVGLVRVLRELLRQRSLEAAAALLEETFPELDNRLINYVQFSRLETPGALAREYLREGVPNWRMLDLHRLRDQRGRRRAGIFLAAASLFFLLPWCWNRAVFGNAVCRLLMPWSGRPSLTIAKIVALDPGNATVAPGATMTISCDVCGNPGQNVALNVWPLDNKKTTVLLGKLTGAGPEHFSYVREHVTVGFDYRLIAGDARSDRFAVEVQDPVAVSALTVAVQPPKYTALAAGTYDALQSPVPVPDGSTLTIRSKYSAPVSSQSLWMGPLPVGESCIQEQSGRVWTATTPSLHQVDPITFQATPKMGAVLTGEVSLERIPDTPPLITIEAPTGQPALHPGARPSIAFSVADDYGLSRIWIERVAPLDTETGEAYQAQEWALDSKPHFGTVWNDAARPPAQAETRELVFRIVAMDCASPPHRSASHPIVFVPMSPAETLEELENQRERVEQTTAGLRGIVDLQTRNIEGTRSLATGWVQGDSERHWHDIKATQKQVRELTTALLESGAGKAFAHHAQSLRDVCHGPMKNVLVTMDAVDNAPDDTRSRRLARCLEQEETILEELLRIHSGGDLARQHREATNILAMLDAIVRDQACVFAVTSKSLSNPDVAEQGGTPPAELQDRVACDVSLFVEYCREQVKGIRWNDKDFAACLQEVVEQAGTREIAPNMFRAAEQLEQRQLRAAVQYQECIAKDLDELRRLMREWRTTKAKENLEKCREALAEAKEKLTKAREAQRKARDELREVVPIKGELTDEQLADVAERQRRMDEEIRDMLLKAARDLHVFPELAIGTELAEEVRDVYEETKQVAGSEENPITEAAIQKDDNILKKMDKAIERLEDSPYWLPDVPDSVKRDYEAYDQEELPEIPPVPMDKKVDDLIGELMEQEEELAKESEDSASNRGGSMESTGNASVKDLNFVNYSAKGKSGNRRPEHSERSGRSILGRRGMSEGETAVSEGEIREGDPNMDERRTRDKQQDGEVDERSDQTAKATGGGKASGYGDEPGMTGSGDQRDPLNAPPMSRQEQLRRNLEALYAGLGFAYYRTGAIDDALRHMHTAERAQENGQSIGEIAECQRRAVAALRRTRAKLTGGILDDTPDDIRAGQDREQRFTGMVEQAPARYRRLVSEYFKALGED